MDCQTHKFPFIVICTIRNCYAALCYKCLLAHEHRNDDKFVVVDELQECLKKRSALFIPALEEIRPSLNNSNSNNNLNAEIQTYKKLFKIMLFLFNSWKSECSQFSMNEEETQETFTIYFCKGAKNGCAKKTEKIWGTGFYTGDSDICLAARHSGAIEENGGLCIIEEKPGMSSYKGTLQNGIQSNSYGAYKKTIYLKSLLKL